MRPNVHVTTTAISRHALTPTRPDAGSDFALRALYRDHAAALTSYAAWFTDDRAAAEDAVQETFLRAWRHLPRLLADGRPLRPWLRQVLRHVLVDAARLARTRRLRPLDDTDDPEVDGGYESVLDRGVLARAVGRRRLSTGGCWSRSTTATSAERAAVTLGIPAGTVRSGTRRSCRASARSSPGSPERRYPGGRMPWRRMRASSSSRDGGSSCDHRSCSPRK